MLKKLCFFVFCSLFAGNIYICCEEKESIFLFGVDLETATRSEFREAIKSKGAIVEAERDDYFSDKYRTNEIMKGSSILTVGYTMEDDFSTAIYDFPSIADQDKVYQIRDMLVSKYGKPSKEHNPKLGLVKYVWEITDNLLIILEREWPPKIVSLMYKNKRNYLLQSRQGAMITAQQKQEEYKKMDDLF